MVTSICAHWTDQTTIDIQEILNLPMFVQSLETYAFEYTVPSQDGIVSLLKCALLTQPIDIILC